MFIAEKESFLVRVMLKKVRDENIDCVFVPCSIDSINSLWQPNALITFFIEDSLSPSEGLLHFLSDKMQEEGNSFFGPLSDEMLDTEEIRAFDAFIFADKENQVEEQIKKLLDEDNSPVTLLTGIAPSVVATEPNNIYDALALATDVARNRVSYDIPLKNPLPKLFVEKKEDGDKARFAKKKGGFDPAAHKRENVTYNTKAPTAEEILSEEPMVEES